MNSSTLHPFFLILFVLFIPLSLLGQKLYEMPDDEAQTRWITFENSEGAKGAGGQENKGAKGHPFDEVKAGQTVTLMDFEGAGSIRRIWLTISDRSPEMLRSLRLQMYWDGATKPAVSVPLGDFFGIGLGQRVPFESALFSDAEGRSFNCFIPMPFKTAGKVTITNDSKTDLKAIFYEIDILTQAEPNDDALYFHTYWNRDQKTELGKPYQILPKIEGTGRFLGTNIGLLTDPDYGDSWWGEGEVKIYLDGDNNYPTLVGTGTEDYVGTAYGQGIYDNQYQGSLITDKELGAYAFYRYHIPDPVYFYDDIRVTIQQMGGWPRNRVRELVNHNDANLQPVTVDGDKFYRLMEQENAPDLTDADFPTGWTNFFREDDISATAYFYLDQPTHKLPDLPSLEVRTADLPQRGQIKSDL